MSVMESIATKTIKLTHLADRQQRRLSNSWTADSHRSGSQGASSTATALIPSPDHLHVYATEPELDSISVWNVHQDEPWASNGPAGVKRTNGTLDALGMQGWPDERSVSFVERRAHGENRIRFRGMNSSDPLEA